MPVLIPLYMFISYYRNYLERFASAALSLVGKKPERESQLGEIPFILYFHVATQRVATRSDTSHSLLLFPSFNFSAEGEGEKGAVVGG